MLLSHTPFSLCCSYDLETKVNSSAAVHGQNRAQVTEALKFLALRSILDYLHLAKPAGAHHDFDGLERYCVACSPNRY